MRKIGDECRTCVPAEGYHLIVSYGKHGESQRLAVHGIGMTLKKGEQSLVISFAYPAKVLPSSEYLHVHNIFFGKRCPAHAVILGQFLARSFSNFTFIVEKSDLPK